MELHAKTTGRGIIRQPKAPYPRNTLERLDRIRTRDGEVGLNQLSKLLEAVIPPREGDHLSSLSPASSQSSPEDDAASHHRIVSPVRIRAPPAVVENIAPAPPAAPPIETSVKIEDSDADSPSRKRPHPEDSNSELAPSQLPQSRTKRLRPELPEQQRYEHRKTALLAAYHAAVIAAATLSVSLPSSAEGLANQFADSTRLLLGDSLDRLNDTAIMAKVGAQQYLMSKSNSSQLICAYNTGRLLFRLYNSSDQYKSSKRLAEAICRDGFGVRSVRALMTFAKKIDNLGCYKLLYSLHDLSWGQIARHINDFFEFVTRQPATAFTLRS
eukprot:c18153_g1_i3.p1 GENE.c18153_g1_i3~~c18153_g1_i3.p1  ORF type:complete len:347 (-),score=32.28 c18153_g1_i3:946-1926(-)